MNEIQPTEGKIAHLDYTTELNTFEEALIRALTNYGLPTENVLVTVSERGRVFLNATVVMSLLEAEKRARSIYISKFIAASASGLFDAALNYLWDETVRELRDRVVRYDINYFYDVAIDSQEKRRKLNTEEDIDKISDAELIKGAKDISLIGDLGYRHLDHIKYMRNWASAAHPNHNEITGLQLITMLETCIKEVINLPISHIAIEIKQLLANIRRNSYSAGEINSTGAFLENANQTQINNLAQGLYGIYTSRDKNSQITQNINLLAPHVWRLIDDDTKRKLGVKLATSVANGDNVVAESGRAFFNIVSGLSYVPEGILSSEITTVLQNLYNSHHNLNNFYNEPPFARQLSHIVGQANNIPKSVETTYVMTIVDSFLTNGNGIAFDADHIYKKLIEQFDETQAIKAMMSYRNSAIGSKLQFSLAKEKFKELIGIIKPKLTTSVSQDFANTLLSGSTPLDRLNQDSQIIRSAATLIKIVES